MVRTINTQMLVRRDTSENWSGNNPTLANGEIGFDSTVGKIKVGDGVTPWNGLSYFALDVEKLTCYSGTTSYWESLDPTVSKNNVLYIVTDYKIKNDNGVITIIPGMKIGDGINTVSNLPYINSQYELEAHMNDTTVHINNGERDTWNNKISITDISDETITFINNN